MFILLNIFSRPYSKGISIPSVHVFDHSHDNHVHDDDNVLSNDVEKKQFEEEFNEIDRVQQTVVWCGPFTFLSRLPLVSF